MQTYIINCLENTGFCEWSHENPLNRKQIIEHFNDLRESEGLEIPKKYLTLKFIASFWNVSITKSEGLPCS